MKARSGLVILVLFAGATLGFGGPEVRASDTPEKTLLWVGHQVTLGRRVLPVLGTVETRSDTWVLALVSRTAGKVELVERACRVRMAEAAGAKVTLADAAVRALPPTRVVYTRRSGAEDWRAGPWRSGWDAEDHDQDGHPGVSLAVDAPLCGGHLFVASRALSIARASDWQGALRGELKVKLAQTILGAEGACLGLVSSDRDERLLGRVAYLPVRGDATCDSLEREGWLDRRLADESLAP